MSGKMIHFLDLRALAGGAGEKTSKDYWQAGKSVAGIHAVEPVGEIVRRFATAAY
jgi:hypothetical protein